MKEPIEEKVEIRLCQSIFFSSLITKLINVHIYNHIRNRPNWDTHIFLQLPMIDRDLFTICLAKEVKDFSNISDLMTAKRFCENNLCGKTLIFVQYAKTEFRREQHGWQDRKKTKHLPPITVINLIGRMIRRKNIIYCSLTCAIKYANLLILE
uniref:Uncharacterized protein n=1 Tax=Romanomermis culicivorax TaxID=13658 RepID=A0A915HU78_ROMCU